MRHAAAPYHREVAGGQRPSHHDSPNEETNKYSMNKWPIPTCNRGVVRGGSMGSIEPMDFLRPYTNEFKVFWIIIQKLDMITIAQISAES